MRLSELLVNTQKRSSTGSTTIDNMLSEAFESTVGSESLPVDVESSVWENFENPRRLVRSFQFNSSGKQRYFINEILSYQDREKHHCKMTIEGNSILIEVCTHYLNDVTSLDLKLAKFADEIYHDTQFFK